MSFCLIIYFKMLQLNTLNITAWALTIAEISFNSILKIYLEMNGILLLV